LKQTNPVARRVRTAMGIYDRDYYRKDAPSLFDTIIPDGRVCRWLIGLNIFVYVLQLVFRRGHGDLGPVTNWLCLDTAAVSHGEVWRLITHAFVHDPDWFWHIVFNMVALWWFGTDLEVIYGPREFLAFYLMAAFLGGAVYCGWALTQPFPTMRALGASGAVTATLILCACHFPHRTVLFMFLVPMPIWLFVLVSVGQDLYRLVNTTHGIFSPVGVVAHLAGAAFGFVYYKQQWRVLNWWPDFTRFKHRTRTNLRLYRPDREKEAVTVAAAPSSGEMDEHLEAKLDAVLEKVSRHGQASLTENERKILLRASEIYKRKRT
jgi:rhomboid family protein